MSTNSEATAEIAFMALALPQCGRFALVYVYKWKRLLIWNADILLPSIPFMYVWYRLYNTPSAQISRMASSFTVLQPGRMVWESEPWPEPEPEPENREWALEDGGCVCGWEGESAVWSPLCIHISVNVVYKLGSGSLGNISKRWVMVL